MKKTQRRRTLYGKTRRRRQRGGQLGRRAFVYLALLAWVFALLPKVTGTTVRETTVWDVAKWTARDIGEAAQGYFESLKSKTPIVLPGGEATAVAGAKTLETKFRSGDTSFRTAAERVASIAVDAYETGDKMSIDFSLVTAEKAGEAIVTAGSYVNGFFDGLSQILTTAADNLEKKRPVLPLIEEEAKADEAGVPATPSSTSELGKRYSVALTLSEDENEEAYNPPKIAWLLAEDANTYTLSEHNDGYQEVYPKSAIKLTRYTGKGRRKTLRRKK